MKILEFDMVAPIGKDEVDRLTKAVIEGVFTYEFLIIDSGTHEFEAISAMKYMKDELLAIKKYLERYKKIGVIHPPQYSNVSDDPEKLQYFTSKEDARNWFLS